MLSRHYFERRRLYLESLFYIISIQRNATTSVLHDYKSVLYRSSNLEHVLPSARPLSPDLKRTKQISSPLSSPSFDHIFNRTPSRSRGIV